MKAESPRLALVIPVYNEESVLPELFRRLDALFAAQPGPVWQVVFVNDGSRDRTVELLTAKLAQDRRYRLVDFSRNFGHQAALTAGLVHAAEADAVITMDADLQDPPEVIPALVDAWRQGAEVVLAVRRSRKERGLRRLGFELFHGLFGRLSDFPVENNTGTFGLLDRAAVAAFNQLPEQHRFFPGLRVWVGFTRREVPYDRELRAAGEPVVTLPKLIRYALVDHEAVTDRGEVSQAVQHQSLGHRLHLLSLRGDGIGAVTRGCHGCVGVVRERRLVVERRCIRRW